MLRCEIEFQLESRLFQNRRCASHEPPNCAVQRPKGGGMVSETCEEVWIYYHTLHKIGWYLGSTFGFCGDTNNSIAQACPSHSEFADNRAVTARREWPKLEQFITMKLHPIPHDVTIPLMALHCLAPSVKVRIWFRDFVKKHSLFRQSKTGESIYLNYTSNNNNSIRNFDKDHTGKQYDNVEHRIPNHRNDRYSSNNHSWFLCCYRSKLCRCRGQPK